MLVHVAASAETWIWKAVAYAVSHWSVTWVMVAVAPRSTWIHCGSLNALDQRVPVLPSTAADAGVPPFSVEDAVAGRPCDSSVLAAPAVPTTRAAKAATVRETAAPSASTVTRRRRRRSFKGGIAKSVDINSPQEP